MEFIVWHYLTGWKWYWKRFWFNLRRLEHYFSFGVLIKTLLAPWKRMRVVDDEVGFDIGKFFENLSFDLISIMIGAIVRLGLIIFFVILVVVYSAWSMVWFLVWWVIPIFGWDYYKLDKENLGGVLQTVENNIKNNPQIAAQIIFESGPGKFVLGRLEKDASEIVKKIQISQSDLNDFDCSSMEKLVKWFLGKDVNVETELHKIETNVEELVLAAKWWDRRQFFIGEKEMDKWELGRPGIGWGLLFGYTPNLDKYSEDLSIKQIFSSHLIGREKIVERMEKTINSGKNILLVGDPGVGKMTVVYAFAEKAITGKLGKELVYKKLVLFDYRMAMAGAVDSDVKKKILTKLMGEAQMAGNIILVMKDISRITNAEVEGNDYTDVIEKSLNGGRLKIISVVDRVSYERFLSNDRRILKDFEVIEILPSSKEEAMLILMQAVDVVEQKNNKIKFSIQALRQILEGSDKYITDTPFPEKALELMDLVVENEMIDGSFVTVNEVNKVLSEKTGISVVRLTELEKEKLTNLEDIMGQSLIGQKTAIELVAKSLRSRVVAVGNEKKPIGSFLFLGPTGVGKTETAKVLANVYYGTKDSILRFDMAEYVGNEGLERLVGSVTNNQPGMLTKEIKNKPASLLLLDEIEKAPKEIYNLFLTMLDEGYINDSSGDKVICRHLFVVATSNAGATFVREQVKNGIIGEELQKSVLEYVQKEGIFSPEFLNRFDGVVVFEPLTGDNLVLIARLILEGLKQNLSRKGINLDFEENVVEKLAKDGYNVEFGARPMRRIVEMVLGDLIGVEILKNKIQSGDKIKLVVSEENKFVIEKM